MAEVYLDNPRKKRHKRRRARKVHHRKVAAKARKHRKVAVVKVLANPHRGRKHVAKRKRSRRRGGNPPFFRNPPIVAAFRRGFKDGAFVFGGKLAARALPGILRLPRAGIMGVGLQALVGVGASVVAARFTGGEGARFVAAGAIAAAYESAAVMFNVPFVSGALSSYPDELMGIDDGVEAITQGAEFTTLPVFGEEEAVQYQEA